jgi:hypothetical protein
MSTGHFRESLDMLLRAPDHPAFRVVGLVPAFFHIVSAWPTGRPITEMRYPTGEWLPVFLLSLSSIGVIGLTYAISLRAGSTQREGFLAAFLMFASTSFLITTQHFFPYDISLAMFLFALWIGMKTDGGLLRSVAVGLLCGFAFLTYEGFWLMAAVVACLHVFRRPRSPVRGCPSVLFTVGIAVFPVLLIVAGHFIGRPFLQALERFSRTVVHGDFSEGWSLPWAYCGTRNTRFYFCTSPASQWLSRMPFVINTRTHATCDCGSQFSPPRIWDWSSAPLCFIGGSSTTGWCVRCCRSSVWPPQPD